MYLSVTMSSNKPDVRITKVGPAYVGLLGELTLRLDGTNLYLTLAEARSLANELLDACLDYELDAIKVEGEPAPADHEMTEQSMPDA